MSSKQAQALAEYRNAFKSLVEIQVELRKYTYYEGETLSSCEGNILELMKKASQSVSDLTTVRNKVDQGDLVEAYPVFYQFFQEVLEEWPFLNSRLTANQKKMFEKLNRDK